MIFAKLSSGYEFGLDITINLFIELFNSLVKEDLSIFSKTGTYKSAISLNLPFFISNLINIMIDSAFLISSFIVITASQTLALLSPFGFFI